MSDSESKTVPLIDLLVTELSKFEQVDGKGIYTSLVDSGKLCYIKTWFRVLKEVSYVNADFQTLRTFIAPVTDVVGVLHFLMYPADGAMADKPLCGRILIPRDYPSSPPVVHLLTRTNRYNVDIYHTYTNKDYLEQMHSSMCFDILRSKDNGGIWEIDYTLSALIASLLQAIVSLKVVQEYGGEKEEFVSMETLAAVHHNVDQTYDINKAIMPIPKSINKIDAVPVTTKYFSFPKTITSNYNQSDLIVTSNSILLQKIGSDPYTIGLDLTNLKSNPYTIFSLVLSNSMNDLAGKRYETILIRNGVTATAAKKKYGNKINWFYHGKPMNQNNLRLIVTIGHGQFCISYIDNDRKIVHGDCPVSFLTPAEIGDVTNIPFYLNIYMKNKRGSPITITTFKPESGYLHPIVSKYETKKDKWETMGIPPPVYVSASLNGDMTQKLKEYLMDQLTEQKIPLEPYKVKRGVKDNAHVTLAYYNEFPTLDEYATVIESHYLNKKDKEIDIEVIGYGVDKHCVAAIVKLNDDIKYYPIDKKLHLTMMLNGKQPVYSNELLKRLSNKDHKLTADERLIMLDKPLQLKCIIKFNQTIKAKKEETKKFVL